MPELGQPTDHRPRGRNHGIAVHRPPKLTRRLKVACRRSAGASAALAVDLRHGVAGRTRPTPAIDPTRFPFSESKIHAILQKAVPPDAPEPQKGAALSRAMTNRPGGGAGLDLRLVRQRPVGLARPAGWTTAPTASAGSSSPRACWPRSYATNLAKYGTVDAENEWLKEAREKRFAFSEDSWWLPSSESEYRKGIELHRKYEAAVTEGKAVFNMRSDDIYNLFTFILSNQFLDQPHGPAGPGHRRRALHRAGRPDLLHPGGDPGAAGFPGARGPAISRRSAKRGGDENIQIAFRRWSGSARSTRWSCCAGATIRSWPTTAARWRAIVISIRERLNDVAQSIRR
ncbi:MAG: DUF2333 family protein [Desulfobacterales bacterium]|nr:DUF2333 family protein [Desulfobacterales bacterium]